MRLIIACFSALALAFAIPAMACPPDVVPDDGGGSFSSFGGMYGTFGAGGGCGADVASFSAPAYGLQSFAAPSYGYGGYAMPVGGFGRPRFGSGFGVGYGGFSGRRFGVGGGYGRFASPLRVRSFAAPVRVHYAAPVVAAPVVAAPVYGGGFGASVVVAPRAPGPFRGAVQGFFGGLKNRLNGF